MNLFKRQRASSNGVGEHPDVHITWARSSVGRSISRTGLFLKRQIWLWPIIAIVLLSAIGLVVRETIETTMRQGVQSQLQSVVDLDAAMLENWYRSQASNAESLANNIDIREVIYPLFDAAPQGSENDTDSLALNRGKLERSIRPAISAHRYDGYIVFDRAKTIVAAGRPELLGKTDIPEYAEFLDRALDGSTNVSPPFPSVAVLKDEEGRARTGTPTMFVAAPIRDDSFQVVGVLALRIDPTEEFSRILSLGHFGQSGKSYAVDGNGRMVSESRFNNDLVLIGLLPDEDDIQSILQVLVRDPGGDLTEGHRPEVRRRKLPLTLAAEELLTQEAGANVSGYRDYRGVTVVGAWKWLPQGDIGVITEMDFAEAFRPLTFLRRTFWGLFALLVLSSAAIFVFTLLLARSRREEQKAVIAAEQVGQYKLEQRLGSGGMGVVYKAQHAMLRRPTAVKMLEPDKISPATLERFEREVQITSQLNNPNTVAIYDYGRTPEGVFYYAMEFLDGIDLQSLVDQYGPQPVPRVIHILDQLCGSLFEAHSLGLVHRDIKPANIMLNRRGGQPDVVKVLDFGLVKSIDDRRQAGLTQHASLTGTPLYMSPEAIEMPSSVDARSDIYAVGAVGYFLLAGRPVFEADNLVELCKKHVETPPVSPSERTGFTIPQQLEGALMACLEKSRAKRPQTARDLALLIARCPEARDWSIEDADAWWGRYERGRLAGARPTDSTVKSPGDRRDLTIDL